MKQVLKYLWQEFRLIAFSSFFSSFAFLTNTVTLFEAYEIREHERKNFIARVDENIKAFLDSISSSV